jgi:hypothetical protein
MHQTLALFLQLTRNVSNVTVTTEVGITSKTLAFAANNGNKGWEN